MREVLKKDLLAIEENMKIIDIFPDHRIVYLFGNDKIHHHVCFKKLADTYFSKNEEILCLMEEGRIETFEDYLVKTNHVLLLNLTPIDFSTSSVLVFFQDSITTQQELILFEILEKSKYEYVRICIHESDNRYGPYHYEEYYETPKTLKKEKYLVV